MMRARCLWRCNLSVGVGFNATVSGFFSRFFFLLLPRRLFVVATKFLLRHLCLLLRLLQSLLRLFVLLLFLR